MDISLLHICPSFNNTLYSQITERQIKMGLNLRVFYFRRKGEGLPNGEKNYVDGCMPFSSFDRLFFYLKEYKIGKKFFSYYERDQFRIIHAHTLFTSGYIALQAKKKWGIPYIVAVRGSDVALFFKIRIWLRRIGIKILENADKIIFISYSLKNEVIRKYIAEENRGKLIDKIEVIPNGIDDFWLNNEPDKIVNCYDKITLIYYGDVNKNKNITATIEAVKCLQKQGVSVEFYIAGKIVNKRYKREIESHKFIRYLGYLKKEELRKYLMVSDIFVMPSLLETFGLSYVEAMSQGCPIIYTKGQGFDGQFKEGIVGFHVNPNSPLDIAHKIVMIKLNRSAISNRCIKCAQRYNWDNIVKKYANIYKEILNK